MKTNKELIDSLKFAINQKANEATKERFKIMNTIRDTTNIEPDKLKKMSFYAGQYMAYNEIYSMLINSFKNY